MTIKIVIIIITVLLLVLGTSQALSNNTGTSSLPVSPLQPNSRTIPVYGLQGGSPNTTEALQPTQMTFRLQ